VLLARAYRSLPRPLSVLEPSHPLASVTLPNDYFSIIIGNHFAVFALTYATTAQPVDIWVLSSLALDITCLLTNGLLINLLLNPKTL
jgi:hypothetical protein